MTILRVWSFLVLGVPLLFGAQASSAACDVIFNLETLDIKCDHDDDLVDVLSVDGMLFVDVGDGLNNLGSDDALADIVIKSRGGDDEVILVGLDVANSIDVKTGNGSDRIFAGSVIVGHDLTMKMGNREDLATFAGVDVGNTVDIKTDQADDTVEVFPFPVGDFPFEIVGIRAGNDIKIDGKQGDDTLTGEDDIDAGNDLKILRFEQVTP